MSEQVMVSGDNLTVHQQTPTARKRPATHQPDPTEVRSKAGRTLEEILTQPNPYHHERK